MELIKVDMNNFPLVTVGIVTYNSSKYILEALNSIKEQSYRNIELIISDDCSSDNTIDLCNSWLCSNRERFVNVNLITVEKNTGTSGNCNRVLNASNGEWIKFLAGDDLLLPDAIEKYVEFVLSNKNIFVTFAESIHFEGNFYDRNFSYKKLNLRNFAFNDKITAKQQFNILTKKFIGAGSTLFAKVSVIKEVGGFDERFKLQEDYPLFIKITKAGYKLFRLDEYVVYKRVYKDSVQYKKNNENEIYGNHVIQIVKDYKWLYRYENLGVFWKIMLRFSLFLHNLVIDSGNDKNKTKCRLFLYLKNAFDPFDWYDRFINLIDKSLKIKQ
ncbi:MAG: glycosyltransferase [Candidatus Phocaeicola faecigallinarum]|uniref:Glycosyltransferase n=1 Tax=Candidatus Phocaeicola faecigallinarum TaxID=2838732 RepID=A0A948T977_9BACT|nr:glycosyltransferase [Candidatus Phocaeicola faecigallinarum]